MVTPPPIAEIMRRRHKQAQSTIQCAQRDEEISDAVDIDEEIKRLEQELADESPSDNDSSDDHTSVVCLSATAHERIEPLPSHALPVRKSRRLKIDEVDELPSKGTSSDNVANEGGNRRAMKKARREQVLSADEKNNMLAAVKEMMAGYVARSSERISFYCRVCQVRSENETEFLEHKMTEFHKLAVKEEQKASYCKACRKQLTSVVQLHEHLSSKPHRDRMDYLRATHPRKDQQHSSSKDHRQWC